jgi:hypothetical protein
MDIAELVNKFGLPVGLLLYFIWRDYQTSKEHKADMRDIAVKSVQAIDKSTEALNDSVDAIEKSTTAIGNNSNILNTVKGVLSMSNNKGSGNVDGN